MTVADAATGSVSTTPRQGPNRRALLDRQPMRLSDSVVLPDTPSGRLLHRYIVAHEREAFAAGLRLELCDDFDLLAAINLRLDKLPLTPQFDPAVSKISGSNGFWLKGVSAQGEVVQTQALRLDDYRDTTLALEFESLRAFYADPDRDAHPAETCTVQAPASHAITGQVCYHGEFWIKATSGLRGTGLGYVLPRIGMAIAFARWEPDFFYGTVSDAIARKGIVARYGYRNLQPGAQYHVMPQSDDVLDEWLMWMTWRDVKDMIARHGARAD